MEHCINCEKSVYNDEIDGGICFICWEKLEDFDTHEEWLYNQEGRGSSEFNSVAREEFNELYRDLNSYGGA